MEYKFRHEHHNRQDKALKPDYREDFISESQSKSSPEHLANFKRMLALRERWLHEERRPMQCVETSSEIEAFKDQVLLRYYDGVYCLEGRDFRFRWNLKEYIERNGITEYFSRTYTHHKKMAVRDFKEIQRRIHEAATRWGISKKGQQQPQFTFSPILVCDMVLPFRTGEEDFDLQTLLKR